MATLYVENVPDEIYEALRQRAKENRNSIATEVISLLERDIPTAAELKRRQKLFERIRKLQLHPSAGKGPFPTAVELLREDRER